MGQYYTLVGLGLTIIFAGLWLFWLSRLFGRASNRCVINIRPPLSLSNQSSMFFRVSGSVRVSAMSRNSPEQHRGFVTNRWRNLWNAPKWLKATGRRPPGSGGRVVRGRTCTWRLSMVLLSKFIGLLNTNKKEITGSSVWGHVCCIITAYNSLQSIPDGLKSLHRPGRGGSRQRGQEAPAKPKTIKKISATGRNEERT